MKNFVICDTTPKPDDARSEKSDARRNNLKVGWDIPITTDYERPMNPFFIEIRNFLT